VQVRAVIGVAGTLGGAGLALVVACSSPYEEGGAGQADVANDVAAPDDVTTVDRELFADASDAATEMACTRFVDSFDDDQLFTPFWTDSEEVSGSVELLLDGGLEGGAVRTAVRLSDAGSDRQAFLYLSRSRLPTDWSFCLSFAVRIAAPIVGTIQGPRIVASTPGLAASSIIVSFQGTTMYLGQYTVACPDGGAGCDADVRIALADISDRWARVKVTGAYRTSPDGGRGEMQVLVDAPSGRTTQTMSLRAELTGYPNTAVRIGITNASVGESADLHFDDVGYSDDLP
jgi:hypothetical protein